MRLSVLIDNIPSGELIGEWGLALLVEYENGKILLDGGTTGDFLKNAERMGLDLSDINTVVLSHAHFDHADGLDAFLEGNPAARLYIRSEAKENCWSGDGEERHYIGIKKGLLEKYAGRIIRAEGLFHLNGHACLLGHTTPKLYEIGRKAVMYLKNGDVYETDDFRHEQTLIIDDGDGLVLLSSCSHAGADNIIREARAAFPDRPVRAMIGGFHLFRFTDEEVRAFAKRLVETGIRNIVTGHCTGEHACELLKGMPGLDVTVMHSGLVMDV